MKIIKLASAIISITLLSNYASAFGSPLVGWDKTAADTIYYGGDIITMNDKARHAEAVAVQGGKIVAVGSGEEILKHSRMYTKLVDLNGKTLLPGFIDSHSHITMVGMQAETARILPVPDGKVNSIPKMIQTIQEWTATNPEFIKKSGWILAFGYDDSQLVEQRHPLADELDAISTELPVAVVHQSGHLASLNHKALELLGYTKGSPNPEGGVIRREADGVTPNGVVEEAPAEAIFGTILGSTDTNYLTGLVSKGAEIFAQNGFTTAQDGKTPVKLALLMSLSTLQGPLPIDVTSYIDSKESVDLLTPKAKDTTYFNGFRIAGHKVSIDGSPQGKTAWLTQPYYVVPEGLDPSYSGYPAVNKDALQSAANNAYKHDLQLLIHANGDAAIDWMIEAVRIAQKTYGKKDLRPVLIHGQTLRADQIPALADLGVIASLFTLHTFYWGDWHYESVLGPKRANFISPTRAAMDAGLVVTTHTDSPVVLPSAMRMVWSTVNRQTRTGRILGEDQRLTAYEALKAITVNAAYQYFEEDRKGSIEPGKLADFVVLSDNPLNVDPSTIDNIKVLETIKKNKNVYSQDSLTINSVVKLLGTDQEDDVVREIRGY